MSLHKHQKALKLYFILTTVSVIILLVLGAVSLGYLLKQNKTNSGLDEGSLKISFNKLFPEVESIVVNKQSGDAQAIPVLLYHGIVEKDNGSDVTYENFKQQMFKLKTSGYNTISLQQFYDFINNKQSFPKGSFLLTFDDGRRDSFYPVDPILKALNYNAVMFVISSESFGKTNPYYLSDSEINFMKASGRWEIESHTHAGHEEIVIDSTGAKGHILSNKKWLEDENRIENDTEYKERIEGEFRAAREDMISYFQDKSNIALAYPFGDYGQDTVNNPSAAEVIKQLAKKYFSLTFTQNRYASGYSQNYSKNEDNLYHRIEVDHKWTADNLISLVEGTSPKNLPFREDWSNEENWQEFWGQYSLEADGLNLSSTKSTSGAGIFLEGGYLWENYNFSIISEGIHGTSLTIMGRFKDDNNYIGCEYTSERITLKERQNGIDRIIKTWTKKSDIHLSKQLGISFMDDNTKCLYEGQEVLNGKISSGSGTIGVKIWDEKIGETTNVNITNLKVEQAIKTDAF